MLDHRTYLNSTSLDEYESCPRKHYLTRVNPLMDYPLRQLKDIINREIYKTSNRTVALKAAAPFLESSFVDPQKFKGILEYMTGQKSYVIGMDAYLPLAIAGLPINVYVPWVVRNSKYIFFIWPEFIQDKIDMKYLMNTPSVLSLFLTTTREGTIDTSRDYYTVIANGDKVYAIRKKKAFLELARKQMEAIIGGITNAKEATRPGAACATCEASSGCMSKQTSIDGYNEQEVFIIS